VRAEILALASHGSKSFTCPGGSSSSDAIFLKLAENKRRRLFATKSSLSKETTKEDESRERQKHTDTGKESANKQID